jgi:acetyl-CoA synthetase
VKPVWMPSDELQSRSNLARLLRVSGLNLDDLCWRAKDPEWFWDAVVKDLGLVFDQPYERVLDASGGIEWPRWFPGSRLNLATSCVDRWAASAPKLTAVRWEGEDGSRGSLSYEELRALSDRAANGLASMGVAVGDVVGIFLPMIPEAAIAFYACAKLGAIAMPMFSGFEAMPIASRLVASGARVLVTADGCYRRGSVINMKEIADRAAEAAPALQSMLVVQRLRSNHVRLMPGRDVLWEDLLDSQPASFQTCSVDSEAPVLLAYTSGTTGTPKGTVHVHAGLLVSIAKDAAYHLDLRHANPLFWVTDMGWIMGPWQLVAAGALGATVVLCEGAPAYPGPDRLWEVVERNAVQVLGVSPSLIRGLAAADGDPAGRDMNALRIIGATGEPWDSTAWWWLFEKVGHGHCPIINISGGTEVGGALLAPLPLRPLTPCTLGGPALGLEVAIFGPDGTPTGPGEVGELVCTAPWPSITRGLWGDHARYLDTYWRRWPGVWVQGDWASVDADGYWYLHGRSDDTLNVAGKRLGPAEVEAIVTAHPGVSEAAAVGMPHPVKGEAMWCFVAARPGHMSADMAEELASLVAAQLGKAFRPERVLFVQDLPRTRSAKLVRRAIRAAAQGLDPGDVSGIENPQAITDIRVAAARD